MMRMIRDDDTGHAAREGESGQLSALSPQFAIRVRDANPGNEEYFFSI
jgi:hypothetical protein